MKLNGWERLGIVASVLWVVVVVGVACVERWGSIPYQQFYFVEFVPDPTREPVTEVSPETGKQHSYKPVTMSLSPMLVLRAALFPLLIVWPLIYAIVWVVRWVKRGFSGG